MTVRTLYYILDVYMNKGYADRKVVIDELTTRSFGHFIETVDTGDNKDDDIHLSFHL